MKNKLIKRIIYFIAPLLFLNSCAFSSLVDLDENDEEIVYEPETTKVDIKEENYRANYRVTWMNGDTKLLTESIKRNSDYKLELASERFKAKLIKETEGEKYKFIGWNITRQENDIGDILDSDSFVINTDLTFYAVYSIKQFNINWYNGDELLYSEEVIYGTLLKFKSNKYRNPVKSSTKYEYYEYSGWSTERLENDIGIGKFEIEATDDFDLYATFKSSKKKVTITFYNANTRLYSEDFFVGEKIVFKTKYTPSKEQTISSYYTFIGWNYERQRNDIGDIIEGDIFAGEKSMSLFAVYSKNTRKYNITFIDDDNSVIEVIPTLYDQDIIPPTKYSKFTGRVKNNYLAYLKGWSKTSNGEIISLPKVTKDDTYYAIFDKYLIGMDSTNLDYLLEKDIVKIVDNTLKAGLYWTKWRLDGNGKNTFVVGNVKNVTTLGKLESNVANIYIGEGITTLLPDAFKGSYGLYYAYLPSTLTSVGDEAFYKNVSTVPALGDTNKEKVTIQYNGTKKMFNSLNPTAWCDCKQVICTDGTFSPWWTINK